jgi:hypothetical protein
MLAPSLDPGAAGLECGVDELGERNPLAPELDLLLDDPGDVDQVFHDPTQLLDLAVQNITQPSDGADRPPRCA